MTVGVRLGVGLLGPVMVGMAGAVLSMRNLKPALQAEGLSIALFNVEGSFYAIDNTCTHRGGPLGEGELKGDTVACPWHGAHFNVKTGAVTVPPARAGV